MNTLRATLIFLLTNVIYSSTPIDVYILAGQSNMSGRVSSGFTSNPDVDNDILYYYQSDGPSTSDQTSGGNFTTLSTLATGYYGPEVSMGRTLHSASSNKIAIIKVSDGGRNLYSQWNSRLSSGNPWWQAWQSSTTDAINDLIVAGYEPNIRALCWLQGEADSKNLTYANAYEQNFSNLVTDMYSHLSDLSDVSDTKFITAGIADSSNIYLGVVKQAYQTVMNSNAYYFYFSNDDMTTLDGIHFDVSSVKTIGERFANTVIASSCLVSDYQAIGNLGYGIAATDSRTQTQGYLMFSKESIHTRFNSAHAANSNHVIAVLQSNGQWYYDTNNTLVAFNPENTDLLLASINFQADTITSLEGTSDFIYGIESGYANGDLTFKANFWNGSNNDGEFTADGTGFTYNSFNNITIQAEERSASQAVTNKTRASGYNGNSYMDYGLKDSYLEWDNIEVNKNHFSISIRYALGSSAPRPCKILVNGVEQTILNFTSTGSWSSWGNLTSALTLNKGLNTIKILAHTDVGGPNIDEFSITVNPPSNITIQAEDYSSAQQTRTKVSSLGFTFVDYGWKDSYVEWNNIEATKGTWAITLDYTLGAKTSRPCQILVNGVVQTTLDFSPTGSWNSWQTITTNLILSEGLNTIKILAHTDAGGPNINEFTINAEELCIH